VLRITKCMSAEEAIKYHDHALKQEGDYYLRSIGQWRGKLAEQLNLTGEVRREDFVSIAKNLRPGSDERLTARTNTERVKKVNGKDIKVANRQAGYDFTASVRKSWSIYLARNPDDEVMWSIVKRANDELMDLVEKGMEVKVRGNGTNANRNTGNFVCASFLHEETRPVSGSVDPHVHFHNWVANCSFDPAENRIKAGQFRNIKANAPWLQAVFHHKVAQYSIEAGYAVRRGPRGVELACVREDALKTFSKRTQLIEQEISLNETKLRAKAARLAERNDIDINDAWAIVKSEVGARNPEKKSEAVLTKEVQREDWRQQYGEAEWDGLTCNFARNPINAGLPTKVTVMENAVEHVFEKRSVSSLSVLKAELLVLGEGVVSIEEVENFVELDERFMRHPWKNGITLHSIYAEELQIAQMIRSGRGNYQEIGGLQNFAQTNLDEAQKEAVKLILSNRDLACAVTGLPGSGKTTTIGTASAAIKSATGSEPFALAPTGRSVQAMKEAASAKDATTIDRLMVDPRLKRLASGRTIFVDEASLMNNEHARWLSRFALKNGSRLVFWGDPKQESSVGRGSPYRDLLDQGLLQNVFLDKIYRQKNAECQQAIKMWHSGNCEEAFDRLEAANIFRETETYAETIKTTVECAVQNIKDGKETMVIALLHQHGTEIASEIRDRLKEEGLVGTQEHIINRLNKLNLTSPRAQRCRPVSPRLRSSVSQSCQRFQTERPVYSFRCARRASVYCWKTTAIEQGR
jgi:conjugative relaxase-like TrwC/TraI family protein